MNPNVQAIEKVAILGVLTPQTVANVEKFTTVVDMSNIGQVMAVAQLGDMAAETVDFKAYTCDSDGTGAAALKAADQLAANAGNNDGKQVAINVRSDELLASGKRYVKFGLVTGGASGGPAAVLVLGTDMRQGLASANDLASVLQLKA